MKITEKISQLQELLQKGETGPVRKGVEEIWKSKLDRSSAFKLAHCARRTNSPEKALKLLHRYVRGTSYEKVNRDARPEEISEYAISLSELGAAREALKLLSLVSVQENPNSGIHLALTHIRLWDWKSAEAPLQELLSLSKLNPFLIFAARVYMGSCILHGHRNYERADKHFAQVIADLEKTNYGILYRSARLLRAQALCFKGEWGVCEKILLEVKEHAERHHSPEFLELTSKWTAIMGLRRDGLKQIHLDRLAEAREGLKHLRLWERVRASDYYLAMVNRDPELIAKLRAGTPYPAFEERMIKEFGALSKDMYQWDLPVDGNNKSKHIVSLDVLTGRNNLGENFLKPGQLQQRLLQALSSDFYRPFKLTELHELVFPGECFNPESSVVRTHKAISRLRSWLEEENFPIVIHSQGESYRLMATSPCRMSVPISKGNCSLPRPVVVEAISVLKQHFTQDFSVQQVVEVLGTSRPTAVRYLSEAVEHRMLERHGKGKKTTYRFIT